jgi:hypothetical protein
VAPTTIAHLVEEMARVRQEIQERSLVNAGILSDVVLLKASIASIEERMNAYERQAKENQDILKRVEVSVNGYEQSFVKVIRFLKWLGAVVTGVLITYIGSIAIHYLHP